MIGIVLDDYSEWARKNRRRPGFSQAAQSPGAAFAGGLRQSAARGAPNPPDIPGRGGFTLVELLLVVAILAILAALLLPALASSKSAALSTVCQSNLNQLGRALSMYASTNRKFPGTHGSMIRPDNPGLSNPRPVTGPWIIWNGQLLPLVAGRSSGRRLPSVP